MDQTTYPSHSAVLDRDDAPFADERYRYLRYCAEGGATAASLKIKRNELLWIAARLGQDASEGIVAKHLADVYHPKLARWHKVLNRAYTQRRSRAEWFRERRGRRR